jgi:hypothetical protein
MNTARKKKMKPLKKLSFVTALLVKVSLYAQNNILVLKRSGGVPSD